MKKRKVKITNTGYLPDSPDRHNPMNIIPSNQITMNKVPFPIMGIDNLGNRQMMLPGMDYTFPGQYVTEIPLGKYQKGKQYVDPYKDYYNIEGYKNLSESPAYRAYTLAKSGEYGVNLSGNKPLPKHIQFDPVTGYVYSTQRDNENAPYPDIDIEGDKHWNLQRFVMNPYVGEEMTRNMRVKKDLTLGDNPFPVGKNLDEQKINIFKDIYGRNLLKYPDDRDRAYNESVALMNDKVEPMLNSDYYKFVTDINIPIEERSPISVTPYTYSVSSKHTSGSITDRADHDYRMLYSIKDPSIDDIEKYRDTPEYQKIRQSYIDKYQPILESYYKTYGNLSEEDAKKEAASISKIEKFVPEPMTKLEALTNEYMALEASGKNYEKTAKLLKQIRSLENAESQDIPQLNYGNRTGQQPNYEAVWDSVNKKWVMRAVESEEKDYYNKKNKIQKQYGGIYLGNYEFKNGGLVKYQDKGQVQSNIAGTNEMWVPSDAMTPEEAKQWGSLRGDALPITGAYASNKAIYKAYDYAKSKGMDYNQYLNWLQGNTKEVRAKQDAVTEDRFANIPTSITKDPQGNIVDKTYTSIDPDLVNYYTSLPNSPFIRDEKTGEIIYAGPTDVSKWPNVQNNNNDDTEYLYAFEAGIKNLDHLKFNTQMSKDNILETDDEALKDIVGDKVDIKKLREDLSKLSVDDLLQYTFDSSPKSGDSESLKAIKAAWAAFTTSYRYNPTPAELVIYGNTPEEAQAQKFADEYAYESMNTPLARFLGAQPGKVNPNVAKRAKIYGYDKVAEQALTDIASTLGLTSTDSEAVRHILQNPESYKNQLLNIISSPFNVGAISLDKTGSNKLSNINLTKEEAQKLIDKIDIVGKSPKFNYMSQATPQDKFIQGSGLGWFLPTSEAAKDANLLDAAFSPFELAGNVAGNYIDSWTQDDFRNEYPTAKSKPLAYSLTDPMGAEFLNTVYQSGLESLGTAAASRLLKGANSTGRYLSNLHKQAFSPVRGSGKFHLDTPGLYDDIPQSLKDLQKLENTTDAGYSRFSESPSSNMALNRLYSTMDELAANPLNKKGKKLVKPSLSGNALEVADKKGLQDLIRHKNSGLSEEEISKFDNIVGDEMLDLDQTAIYYKAKLNQYGANKVNPKNLTWQQRLMNQVPFAKKTQTFYPESKVKFAKSDNQRELYDLFSQNNLNRPFTQEEFNIQKQLFDTPTQWGNSLEGSGFNRSLGYDVRRMLANERGKQLNTGNLLDGDNAKNLYRAGALGIDLALGLVGSLAGKSNKVGPNYIDPYLNPILNKLGINTNDNRAVGNAVIPINEPGSEMRGVRVNESDLPEDFNVIIGGEFIYENPNSLQTAEFYDRNPQFQVGDNAFRASESKAFYGVEDGKLKVGNPNEFKPETPIVPMIPANENDYQPIKEAGIGINGVSLIDKNNQLIYQTAGKGGKLLLYSPKTQNAYFIYNDGDDLQNVVDQINGLIAKDPDLRSVTLDNGRYSYFIQNEKGLRPSDYEDYYEADLSREGNPGFNLVYKKPVQPKKERYGGLVKAQKGLATASDSLDVLNSSLAAEQFYKSRGYSRDLFGPSKLNSAADFRNELEKGKTNYNNAISGRGITDYSKSNQNSFNFDLRNYPNFAYSKPGKDPKHQVYQREQASGVINPQAPMVLYDDRILPQNFAGYIGPDLNPANQMVVDSAGIYTYDKLATTPWSKLTTKQKKQRLQKFGTSGTPYKSVKEGLKTLEGASSKPKEQELERIESKPITRLPITEPKLQPVVYPTLSNNQTNFSKVRPVYRMNYGQHKGQVEVGQDVYNNETKKWQRRMYEPEEIEYNINAGKIKQDGGPIYLGQYEFKDGGLVKYQSKGQVAPADNTDVYVNRSLYDNLYENQNINRLLRDDAIKEEVDPRVLQFKETYPQTWQLAEGLRKVPRYKDINELQWFDLLDMIAQTESMNQNIPQKDGGPGRGYYQFEPKSADTALTRAKVIQSDLADLGYTLNVPSKFDRNFMNLSKDEQSFYALANLVKAASAKREQDPNYKISFDDPGATWLDLHWAGAGEHPKDVPVRIKHWNDTHPNKVIARKYQKGGSKEMPFDLPLKEQNIYLLPEYNQPINPFTGEILPDMRRPNLGMNTGATEYKYTYGSDEGDIDVPSIVAGQYIGDQALDRYNLTEERFKTMSDPGSYSKFYNQMNQLGLMQERNGGAVKKVKIKRLPRKNQ